MSSAVRNVLARVRRLGRGVPEGFHFSRPLVLLQSDDWGRVGVRDAEGSGELRAAGINLGERAYDLYSLETAEDVGALAETLTAVHDCVGRPACLTMNFVLANVDFANALVANADEVPLKMLADGLPGRWTRPGLLEGYREGIAAGVFSPALHGTTHFCQRAAVQALQQGGERADLLRTLWKAETPYIHWRMPWIGYEYWNPEQPPAQRFISESEQRRSIQWAKEAYRRLLGAAPASACAPGYRADATTHRLWREQGICVSQNGPGAVRAPHFDDHGLLHTYRSLDFEPALHPGLRWQDCCEDARSWLTRGLPLVVSVHSINFHSTLSGFRQKTLPLLAEFLKGMKHAFPELLFVNECQLLEIIERGAFESSSGKIVVKARRGKGAA